MFPFDDVIMGNGGFLPWYFGPTRYAVNQPLPDTPHPLEIALKFDSGLDSITAKPPTKIQSDTHNLMTQSLP